MDMAVANLFKHKICFNLGLSRDRTDLHPDYCSFFRNYISKRINNLRDIGVTDINELRTKCLEPFMVYTIS